MDNLIVTVGDLLGYGLLGVGLLGFLVMVVAFGRLFRQAWRSEERGLMVRKVFFVQPRRNAEWPNMTREADWIGFGALCGVIFFGGLLALVWLG